MRHNFWHSHSCRRRRVLLSGRTSKKRLVRLDDGDRELVYYLVDDGSQGLQIRLPASGDVWPSPTFYPPLEAARW